MSYNFNQTKEGIRKVSEWLQKELSSVRTGRATPALLDSVLVDSYGSKTQISHLASIGIDDAKTLRVTPWDKSQIKAIETAIASANLGVSSIPDSLGIRVVFPDVTAERRKVLLKLVNEKTEEAKVSLRGEREKTWNEIQKKEKDSEISEDDKFRLKEELQKLIDEGQRQLLAISEKKQKEIEN